MQLPLSARKLSIFLVFLVGLLLLSVWLRPQAQAELSPPWQQHANNYWFKGKAEIASYSLKQARYGEIREGEAVLVYVTEPMRKATQVKADTQASDDIPVLKLNSMKHFVTGIYPYSIMNSTFSPLHGEGHALKVTSSTQEWCGQVFTQLNNRDDFEINGFSYFESEGDVSLSLKPTHIENDIWTKLRIDPTQLPTGKLKMIPSFDFLRLRHHPIQAYNSEATVTRHDDYMEYRLSYPKFQRELTIQFNSEFPYDIISWTESHKSGFGKNAEVMTTTATRLALIQADYWNMNLSLIHI